MIFIGLLILMWNNYLHIDFPNLDLFILKFLCFSKYYKYIILSLLKSFYQYRA
jgi:hypothetical protein